MNLIDQLARIRARWRTRRGLAPFQHFDQPAHTLEPGEAAGLLASAGDDMERLVFGHAGRPIHKWTHYPSAYHEHMASYRGKSVRLLEIGVFKGGSLEVLRNYFGPDATIFGIDINPDCAGYVTAPNQVRIGSQADPAFLRRVVEEMGGVDIVIDDGSHIASHQVASFRALFPLLSPGGLYVLEDLHTSYWPGPFEGGYQRRGTGTEIIKQLVDDLHGWFHGHEAGYADKSQLGSLHVYDSIAFVKKVDRKRPMQILLGAGADQPLGT